METVTDADFNAPLQARAVPAPASAPSDTLNVDNIQDVEDHTVLGKQRSDRINGGAGNDQLVGAGVSVAQGSVTFSDRWQDGAAIQAMVSVKPGDPTQITSVVLSGDGGSVETAQWISSLTHGRFGRSFPQFCPGPS